MVDYDEDGLISLSEARIFYGWINMWLNMADPETNTLEWPEAYAKGFSQEEFLWMNVDMDESVTFDEFLLAGTEINVFYNNLVNGTF